MISRRPREDQCDYVNKKTICIVANYSTFLWHKQIDQQNCAEKHETIKHETFFPGVAANLYFFLA